jgi:hypothetical protein
MAEEYVDLYQSMASLAVDTTISAADPSIFPHSQEITQ